jgi:type IV pilus assembly protein PilA
MISKIASRFGKGFTLIELMIVVAIIGILAAIAIPNFVKFQCRSKQSEAKTNLKAMYVSQESYYGEYDTFLNIGPCTADECMTVANPAGWAAKGQKIRYAYEASGNDTGIFNGTATGQDQSVDGDTWTINQNNGMGNPTNACSN